MRGRAIRVSHTERAITVFERKGRKWASRVARSGDSITLIDPAISLDVDDIYEDVELD